MMTLDELGKLLDAHAFVEEMSGRLMMIDRPDRWYDDPHWRCINDHVNPEPVQGYLPGTYVWSFQLCPECGDLVRLTFPEDVPGPLKPPEDVL